MKILVIHNMYQMSGGEDVAVRAESRMLAERGHAVIRYERNNEELRQRNAFLSISTGFETVWASRSYRDVAALIANEKPDLAHFHNTLPLISPSAYYACAEAKVPVVQTLHNYRLLCPGVNLLRDGRVCEDCVGRDAKWPALVHSCYRQSTKATLAVVSMLAVHRAMGTWRRKVTMYIALTEFAQRKFIEGGLPANRISVKPNCVDPDPGFGGQRSGYAAFVGRLSEEKGIRTLLGAWPKCLNRIPLRVAGDGPLKDDIRHSLSMEPGTDIELMGLLEPPDVIRLIKGAAFLIYPSQCYETLGMTIVEAFACGVPVIASKLGAMAEIVSNGVTGLHFAAGDESDLAAKVDWAWTHPKEMEQMGRAARCEYEAKYTAEQNYQALMRIYETARSAVTEPLG